MGNHTITQISLHMEFSQTTVFVFMSNHFNESIPIVVIYTKYTCHKTHTWCMFYIPVIYVQ